MRKIVALLLALILTLFCLSALAEEYPVLTGESGLYNAGVYEVVVRGMGGKMNFEVTFSDTAMYRDVLICRQHHQLTELEQSFIRELKQTCSALFQAAESTPIF